MFQKGVNTVIGENGSGKTNLLRALRLLVDDSLPRNIKFYESDFNRTLTSWKGHWIIIQVEFEELSTSEEAQAMTMHKIGSMDEYDSTKGSYALMFRPREAKRKELYDYSQQEDKTKEGLWKILNSIELNDYERIFRGRVNVDFSSDDNYKEYVGDFDNIVFPDPDELQEDIYGTKPFGFSFFDELSCTFVKALRDVEADLRSYKDNPLLDLLRGKEKNIDISQKRSIENKVNSLNEEISNLEEVQDISHGITDSIKQAVGETYAPNIDIKSELPSDMEQLLQSLKLWVGDPDEIGYNGRIWELSLGGANLIYLSLKLLEYEKVKSVDKIANFLLIEEPEAHVHTHIQKTIFQKLNSRNTQIFITTHSTHISSVSKISSMNILSRADKHAIVFNPVNGLENAQIQTLERYLDAIRTNLLFAKGVLLVEGDAEQILIPELVKKVFGVTLDELGISLVNIGSTGFGNVAVLFHDNRVRKKCAIITDLDTSILPLPNDENEDSKEERYCRDSQKSGAERKVKIDSFCKGNNWVQVFYADYTFEVDFLKAGNSQEVILLVKSQYQQRHRLENISKKLENKDIAVSGKEILRLADEKIGKGWFSLMLSEYIDHLTFIPDYIIKAIVHTSQHISYKVLFEMTKYRLEAFKDKSYGENTTDYNSILQKVSNSERLEDGINIFKNNLPDDQLTKFINAVETNRQIK
jgi:predicted ATP-dependent endonuclease of OLD family